MKKIMKNALSLLKMVVIDILKTMMGTNTATESYWYKDRGIIKNSIE